MESTDAVLTGGAPGFTMVEGISSLSKGDGRMGMVRDGADDHNGGLGMVTLLK